MILIFLLFLTVSYYAVLPFRKNKNWSPNYIPVKDVFFGVTQVAAFIVFCNFISTAHEVNRLKAINNNLLPIATLESDLEGKKAELNDVKKLIREASDKNKFQVTITQLSGTSVYAMPMSSTVVNTNAGLGDIERGGATKLKLLEHLIGVQMQIARDIVDSQDKLNRQEVLDRKAEIMAKEGNLLHGVLVRAFTIKDTSETAMGK